MILKSLRILDCLSFADASLEMRPMNMLIGANGSGKTNFIRVLEVLQLLSRGCRPDGDAGFLRYAGDSQASMGSIQAVFEVSAGQEILYNVCLENRQYFCNLRLEVREFFDGQGLSEDEARCRVHAFLQNFRPYRYPYLAAHSVLLPRVQDSDPGKYDVLNANLENFLGVLKRLCALPDVKAQILEGLRVVQEDIEDVSVRTVGAVNHLALRIRGITRDIPYSRVSEGVLRVLTYLVALLNPEKPALACFDMPERGLHFDVLPNLAELFVQASDQGMQLVVATHSDMLLDALHDRAESVVGVERDSGGTSLTRLDGENIKARLENYRLNELWCSGELGAVRF